MRVNYFIWLLVVLSARQFPAARAQVLVNPTAEQLAQIIRSQPAVNISAPVAATAAFDPPLVRPGEKAVYRVTFNATAVSVSWPEKLPVPAELKFHLSASGQVMQSVGGSFQMFSTFNYDARAAGPGTIIIPEFTVEVYGKPVVVPAAQLEVKTELPEPHLPARQLLVEPSATNVFVGEVFSVSVRLPARPAGAVEGVSEVQLNGESFVVDKNAVRQSIQMTGSNGRGVAAYIYETSLTPIAAGALKISAQGFTAGMQFGGPIIISGQVSIAGGPPKFLLLDSEPVMINVRPLPTERELPGFTGTVGRYSCDAPSLATNQLQVGEPASLTVVIRGEKNLGRINPPPPPRVPGWQIFPAVRGGLVAGAGTTNPGASFKYTLIPLTDAMRTTPVIPFSCFDPALGKYVDLTIPPIPVTVVGDGLPAQLLALDDEPKSASPLKLSDLEVSAGKTVSSLKPLQLQGWFVCVQLVPLMGFVLLWQWDRRRRFLEAHPEIVRRRQAFRALRRQKVGLQKAAAAGEVSAFVEHAVAAMRIAVAPHYPANPKALVCGDVLAQLDDTEQNGRASETVRKFFAAADARFSFAAETRADLLALKSDLENVLQKLEGKL